MSDKRLPSITDNDRKQLQLQIQKLQEELENIQQKTRTFEALLRSHVSDLIVEAQELHILYKQIKKAKKAKRLEQKKRGKNYKEPQAVPHDATKKKSPTPSSEQKEKKQLYKEAMLHVHPDKFHMSETETDLATQITSRLIEIYQSEGLETLRAYHAHIFQGNTAIVLENAANVKVSLKENYLQQEKERLMTALELAKNHQLFKVLTEYDEPMTFVDELKEYYEDRILKLKKRTRKALKKT